MGDWTDSLACSISWHDPCDFFLYGCLEKQVFHELLQNISDFETDIGRAVARIEKAILEKGIQQMKTDFYF